MSLRVLGGGGSGQGRGVTVTLIVLQYVGFTSVFLLKGSVGAPKLGEKLCVYVCC